MPWKWFYTHIASNSCWQPASCLCLNKLPPGGKLLHADPPPRGPLCAVLPSLSSLGPILFHPGPGEATCSFVALRLPSQPAWPGRMAIQGKDGMNTLPLSELSWWQPVSPMSLIFFMSSGYCHSRHCQSNTTFSVMKPRHRLPHHRHDGAPGSSPCLFRVGTYMKPAWHSRTKDTSGKLGQGRAPHRQECHPRRVPRFQCCRARVFESLHVPSAWRSDCTCYWKEPSPLRYIWRNNKFRRNKI